MTRNILIGLSGGSGSGKTTVTRALVERFGEHEVTLLEQDEYYRDHPDLSFEDRAGINYDHPDSFDTPLLLDHVGRLLGGQPIERPVYDFATHRRLAETVRFTPTPVLILEGILVLENPELRDLMDIKLYVDTDADVRFIRRLQRDVRERGRTVQKVIDQYLRTVRPMHMQFVEPSKRYADLIIPEGGQNLVALNMLAAKIDFLLRRREDT